MDINLYKNVSKAQKVAALQNVDGKIVKRKAGRPRKKGQRQYGVRLPEELHGKIKAYCERHGYGFSQLIQWLLDGALREEYKRTS